MAICWRWEGCILELKWRIEYSVGEIKIKIDSSTVLTNFINDQRTVLFISDVFMKIKLLKFLTNFKPYNFRHISNAFSEITLSCLLRIISLHDKITCFQELGLITKLTDDYSYFSPLIKFQSEKMSRTKFADRSV